jgi:hypothetical protein
MNCMRCGRNHPVRVMGFLVCPLFETPAAESEWLDKPGRGAGLYWMQSAYANGMPHTHTKPDLVYVNGNWWRTVLLDNEYSNRVDQTQAKWLKANFDYTRPTPPPAPLPTSKQVTLTAKVWRLTEHSWAAKTMTGGKQVDNHAFGSRQAAIKWVRDTHGIEPSTEGEE